MIVNAERIRNTASTLEIIQQHVDLQKRGANYVGLCPFHDEKTPSFHVSPSKNRYKCFGCGESGDAISFLMDNQGLTYPEALEAAARASGQQVEYQEGNRKEWLEEHRRQKEIQARGKALLQEVYNAYWSATWPAGMPLDRVDCEGKPYTMATVQAWGLCWAPGGDWLESQAKKQGWQKKHLQAIGVLSEQGRPAFQGRLLFPIHDHTGKIVSMAGRKPATDTNPKKPKYINGRATDIYDKAAVLYGLHHAKAGIRQAQCALLVEGYTDVISLHEAGLTQAVATCGTALTEAQARLLARFTEHITILRDGDEAGLKAALRDVETLIPMGLSVKVCLLPEGEDPDSFVRKHTARGMRVYLEEHSQDAFVWRVMREWDPEDAHAQEKAIQLAAELLVQLDSPTLQDSYIRELAKKGRMEGRKMAIKEAMSEAEKRNRKKEDSLTPSQQSDLIEFGIYIKQNRYWVARSLEGDGYSVSNFIVKPVMLVIGAEYSLRVVEITNAYGKSVLMSMDASEMTSLDKFRQATERMGNFMWMGKPEEFARMKLKVYKEMREAYMIGSLGLHREGFWTWGNGISVGGKFYPVDENGAVTYKDTTYYLPAFSNIASAVLGDEDSQYEFERKFSYHDTGRAVNFTEWSRRMVEVHGHNGMMAVAWAVSALFRDIIFEKFQFFPHLNGFGPPGSGKSFMARSVMGLFGKSNMHDPFNLSSGTKVAFSRRLAQAVNAISWFDEYSNEIDDERVERLKGAYDGAGHERGVKSQDNRTSTTKVRSAVMFTGQQQPTKDVALFKRCISLNFRSGHNDAAAQRRAKELKDIEMSGALTQLTQWLLQYRAEVEAYFGPSFEKSRSEWIQYVNEQGYYIEDRILMNYLIPVVTMLVLQEKIQPGFQLKELVKWSLENMVQQSETMFSEDETSVFWRIFNYLVEIGLVLHYEDILVEEQIEDTFDSPKRGERKVSHKLQWEEPRRLLYLTFDKVHPEYQKHHRQQRNKQALDLEALKYYLQQSTAYVGTKRAKRIGHRTRRVWVFDVSELPIDLEISALHGKPSEVEQGGAPY